MTPQLQTEYHLFEREDDGKNCLRCARRGWKQARCMIFNQIVFKKIVDANYLSNEYPVRRKIWVPNIVIFGNPARYSVTVYWENCLLALSPSVKWSSVSALPKLFA